MFCQSRAVDVVQVIVFVRSNVLLHFAGTTSPVMSTLTTTSQAIGGTCATVAVSTYAAATDSTLFNGAPVSAATAVGDGQRVVVVVGVKLFVVSAAGGVTLLGLVSRDPVGASFAVSALSFAAPCSTTAG